MKTKLLLGFHIHQPVDNLQSAIDQAVTKCYGPLFATLRKYPKFKTSLHISGWLLERLRSDYPALFRDLADLNESGSVEFFTAGYYEPVLASIPKAYRRMQIEKLNATIQREFGQSPKGVWLTERVWESSIIDDLGSLGMEYVMVDDYHFLAAGFDPEELDGYYFTEEGGKRCALFPISKALRYAIPFYPVQKALEEIKKLRMAIIFDDGEKFGLWPNTYSWVYEKRWLEEFIEAILEDEEIETIHYKDALHQKPKGIAYLPNVSYYEMGEWSLRAKDALELERLKKMVGEEYFERIGMKFIRGGIWKNFFVKYEESNRLHKRMLALCTRPLENEDALLRLQTNDVYWHGIFGGLYLPNLRDNAYRYVALCEKIRYSQDEVKVADEDMDGYEEVTVHKEDFLYRFYTRFGGQMIEFLDKKTLFNFQNCLTRRFEAYHEAILHPKEPQHQQEEGISTIHTLPHEVEPSLLAALHFDWYTKNSFIDHISDESFTLQSFKECNFKEYGDFANQPFTLLATDPLRFTRNGGIYQESCYPTTITKEYHLDDGVTFAIDIATQSPKNYRYALEFNLHFAHPTHTTFNEALLQDGLVFVSDRLVIEDPFTKRDLTLSFDDKGEFFITPLQTISQNEKGYEITIQGVSIAFCRDFAKTLHLEGSLKVRNV